MENISIVKEDDCLFKFQTCLIDDYVIKELGFKFSSNIHERTGISPFFNVTLSRSLRGFGRPTPYLIKPIYYSTTYEYLIDNKYVSKVYFVHELYKLIKDYQPKELEKFIDRCKEILIAPHITFYEKHLEMLEQLKNKK